MTTVKRERIDFEVLSSINMGELHVYKLTLLSFGSYREKE